MYNQRGKAVKANEVNNSGAVGRGSEWIWTMPDGNLWAMLTADTGLMNMFPRFNMVAGKVTRYIDDETGMPQVIPEITRATSDGNNQIDSLGQYPVTPFGTQKVDFEARHIGQQTIISKIDLEDSKIEPIRVARRHLENALRRGVDWTIVNSDTSTDTTNYGHYGEAQTATGNANKLAFIGFRGLVAKALSQDSRGQDNGEGDITVTMLRHVRRLLNSRYYADPTRLLLIMSTELKERMMDVEEFQKTMMYSGRFDGSMPGDFFDRTRIVSSEQVVLRDTEGRLHHTPAENTKDVAIYVRPDRWNVGIRRRLGRSMQE